MWSSTRVPSPTSPGRRCAAAGAARELSAVAESARAHTYDYSSLAHIEKSTVTTQSAEVCKSGTPSLAVPLYFRVFQSLISAFDGALVAETRPPCFPRCAPPSRRARVPPSASSPSSTRTTPSRLSAEREREKEREFLFAEAAKRSRRD